VRSGTHQATSLTVARAKAASLRKVEAEIVAQLGREPSFAESIPAGIQQKVTETHDA